MGTELKTISPYNHGASKTEGSIKIIGNIIAKRLQNKGENWPIYVACSAFAMNTFASEALQGYSPYQLVFLRTPPNLLNISFSPFPTTNHAYKEYYEQLHDKLAHMKSLFLDFRTKQAQTRVAEATRYSTPRKYRIGDLVGLFAPHASALQTNTTKFRKDYVGPLAISAVYHDDSYSLRDITSNKDLPQKYPVIRLKPWAEFTHKGIARTHDELLSEAKRLLPATTPTK
jgi:hypothetical protein